MRCIHSLALSSFQVVRALNILLHLLQNSPSRDSVLALLLDWGVEQLYCLLFKPGLRDEAREMVFQVRP